MPTLLDLLTEQLSTDNNTQALASSSLAVMHLKTLQMQSDDPDNGILRIKLRSYVTSLIGLTNKRVDKRFTFASLSHPKFVNKLKVALLFFSSNSC